MKNCKSNKTNIWETYWETASATEKTKQFPLNDEENSKISAQLYEKL